MRTCMFRFGFDSSKQSDNGDTGTKGGSFAQLLKPAGGKTGPREGSRILAAGRQWIGSVV